eukprot:67640_1
MLSFGGQTSIPKIPLEFYPDFDKFSAKEIQLLASLVVRTPHTNNVKHEACVFEQLIAIQPSYALYHCKYANALTYFVEEDNNVKEKELEHRVLAHKYAPCNTMFIMDYIECLQQVYQLRTDKIHPKINVAASVIHKISCLFEQLCHQIRLFWKSFENCASTPHETGLDFSNVYDETSVFRHCGYVDKFRWLSWIKAVNYATKNEVLTLNLQKSINKLNLNEFISNCFDKYYTFHIVYNPKCDFNEIFRYGSRSVALMPSDWNKRFGYASTLSLKGRYLDGLKQFEHILNAFGGKRVNKSKQNAIIASLHPMRLSQLYLIHFNVLLRLRRFDIALDQYTYLRNNRLIDEEDIIWFAALQIKLFAELSIHKSIKYTKKAFKVYHAHKQSAMFDSNNKDLFWMYYGFLLMVSGDTQSAMHKLEHLTATSKHEGGYIEYMNGYLQHYYFKNYEHAKFHYISSFIHNSQIPEVRYHLCLVLIQQKEYKMAYVQLKQAINMHSGLPYLQDDNVNSFLKMLRKKLKGLQCSNCGRNYYAKRSNSKTKTLSVCKGCGKTYYCNRKCQKRDWKCSHRLQCDKTYKRILKMYQVGSPLKCEFY